MSKQSKLSVSPPNAPTSSTDVKWVSPTPSTSRDMPNLKQEKRLLRQKRSLQRPRTWNLDVERETKRSIIVKKMAKCSSQVSLVRFKVNELTWRQPSITSGQLDHCLTSLKLMEANLYDTLEVLNSIDDSYAMLHGVDQPQSWYIGDKPVRVKRDAYIYPNEISGPMEEVAGSMDTMVKKPPSSTTSEDMNSS